jgi:zinc transport system substrate-binding protein
MNTFLYVATIADEGPGKGAMKVTHTTSPRRGPGRTKGFLVFAVITVIALFAGKTSLSAAPHEKIHLFVSIIPHAYFVERIGGPLVEVNVLVGEGQSPATYEPTPRQMAELGKSRIYFLAGTPFEKGFIDRIRRNFDKLKIVDLRSGVPLRYFKSENAGKGNAADPHIWLNPRYTKIQAVTICSALSEIYPENSTTFVANLEGLLHDLDELDSRISKILQPFKGENLYVFHPAFGYFCDAYGLTQVAIETEGKEPAPRELVSFITRARAENVKAIFVQPQYAKREAEAVARAIGGSVVPINPLPLHYIENMEAMATTIEHSLNQSH